jgi:serine/threonine-protein kinase
MGQQTMMGAASTTASPYQQTGYGYDGGMPPRRSWARRWLPWLIPSLVVIAVIAVAAMLLHGNGTTYFVPQVNGLTQAQAVTQIEQAGLVAHVVQQPSQSAPKGTVISTNPPNGQSVPKGSAVTVYVSAGISDILLPDVTNQQQDQAQTTLRNLGFTNVNLATDAQSTLPSGEVDHQTPPGNHKYPPSVAITLYISGGGVKVPQVVNLSLSSAEATLSSYGLTWKISQTAGPVGENIPPMTVWSQNPQPGTSLPKGSPVTLFVQPPGATTSASPTNTSPSASPTNTSPSATPTSPSPSPTSTSPTPTGGP